MLVCFQANWKREEIRGRDLSALDMHPPPLPQFVGLHFSHTFQNLITTVRLMLSIICLISKLKWIIARNYSNSEVQFEMFCLDIVHKSWCSWLKPPQSSGKLLYWWVKSLFLSMAIHAVQLDGISTVNESHCCFITLMSVENGNVWKNRVSVYCENQ